MKLKHLYSGSHIGFMKLKHLYSGGHIGFMKLEHLYSGGHIGFTLIQKPKGTTVAPRGFCFRTPLESIIHQKT